MARPKGSKNKNPKNTSKIEGKQASENQIDEAVESANLRFIDGLSGEMKELYKGFAITHKLPLDDLRELVKSMKARYNIGLQSEIREHETIIRYTRDAYELILKTGRIRGKVYQENIINKRLRKLELIINKRYYISSQLTTLSAELKNVFVEIERIEAGQPKGNVNIFNILKGEGDKKQIDALEKELFTPDEELRNQIKRENKNDY